jgi:acetolactate decarboxylase
LEIMIKASLIIVAGMFTALALHGQNGPVIATGAMKNTMFEGQLAGLIQMDSLATPGTYGLGPLEYLQGELLLIDGTCFVATTTGSRTMQVDVEHGDVRAPFFVHQLVNEWRALDLPGDVTDLASLDAFLTATFGEGVPPFAFRITGLFESIQVHVLDVPPGTEINGPEDAHRHKEHFTINDREAETIGFFSTQHRRVFTHHDANIHVHAITVEKDWMGHVEKMQFDPRKVRLWVAAE